jgi:hypothetical protein
MADDLDKSQEYLAAKRQFADFLEKDVRKSLSNHSFLCYNLIDARFTNQSPTGASIRPAD